MEVNLDGKQPSHKTLEPNKCFVLDASDNEIFVWVGSKSSPALRKWALATGRVVANERAKEQGWCILEKTIEQGESISFKERFSDFPSSAMIEVA